MLDFLIQLLGEDTIYSIAWTVIHSIWQATLIALIMSFVLHNFSHKSPKWRYMVAICAMLSVIIVSIITFVFYISESAGFNTSEISTIALGSTIFGVNQMEEGLGNMVLTFFDEHLFFISCMWVMGVIVFMFRYLGSLLYIKNLQNSPSFASPVLTNQLNHLIRRIGINKKVEIIETIRVKAPMVIGHIKPVILFPIGVVNSLDTNEVSAIIAHELAHIMRNDFLVNLIQSFAEVLFYYHPAIWWISANIKAERELCCDQIAIEYSGNAISYAKTLVKLKELQTGSMPSLAIPLFSNKKQLLIRIQKILNMPQTRNNIKEKMLALTFLFLAVLLITTQANGNNESKEMESLHELKMDTDFAHRTLSLSSLLPQIDTIPEQKERQTYHISKSEDDKTVSLKMEDGEITELKIDNKVIPESEYEQHEDVISELKPRKNGNTFYFGDGESVHLLRDMETLKSLRDMDFVLPEHFENNFVFPDQEMFNHLHLDSLLAHSKNIMKFSGDSIFMGMGEHGNWPELSEKLREKTAKLHELYQRRIEEGAPNVWEYYLDDDAPTVRRFEHDSPLFQEYQFGTLSPRSERKGSLEDAIGRELNNDRLLEKDKMNKVELTGKYLKINGDKQPKNIWMKYKEIFEEVSGLALSKDSKLKFEIKGERKQRKAHAF